MKEEVDSATGFLAGLIARRVANHKVESFKLELSQRMTTRYEDHWHPQKPQRGSAFRSITIHYESIDPLVESALNATFGEEALEVGKHFPKELTLWVDPKDVSYRIGDNGSIGAVYSAPAPASCQVPGGSDSSDSESDHGSPCVSVSSSPCSSPYGSPPRPNRLGYMQQHQQQQPPSHAIAHQCRQQAWPHQSPYHHNGLMVYS